MVSYIREGVTAGLLGILILHLVQPSVLRVKTSRHVGLVYHYGFMSFAPAIKRAGIMP